MSESENCYVAGIKTIKPYVDMPEEFQAAVEVIKKYCQYEDCEIMDCNDCPYNLRVIRCGEVAL